MDEEEPGVSADGERLEGGRGQGAIPEQRPCTDSEVQSRVESSEVKEVTRAETPAALKQG